MAQLEQLIFNRTGRRTPTSRRAIAACCALAAILAACGTTAKSSSNARRSSRVSTPESAAGPIPPEQPCAIDVSRLANLVSQSTLIVDVKAAGAPTQGPALGDSASDEYTIPSANQYSSSGDGSQTGPIDVNTED